MKKRILAAMLCGAVILSCTGCGQRKNTTEQKNGNNSANSITADITLDVSEEQKSNDISTVNSTEPELKTTPKSTEREKQSVSNTVPSTHTESSTDAQTPEFSMTTKPEKNQETIPNDSKKPVTETVPKAGKNDCRKIAQRVLENINSYRSTPAVKLTGLTEYAEYRSRQLVSNFAHDTDDERAAATALSYGEYVVPALYGMTGEPYYTAGAREAIAKAGYVGTVDEVAQNLAKLIKNSQKHWAYVGNSNYKYIAVGVTYENGMWYCDVAMTMENTDNK